MHRDPEKNTEVGRDFLAPVTPRDRESLGTVDTVWLDFREDRRAQGVAVAFERRSAADQRVVARVCAPIDTEEIAAVMEEALHCCPGIGDPRDVKVRVVHDGIAFSVESARLARVGAVLLARAGQIF